MLLIFAMGSAAQAADIMKYRAYRYAEQKKLSSGRWGEWSDWEDINLTITFNFDHQVIRINNKINSMFLIDDCDDTYTDDDGDEVLKIYAHDEEDLKCEIRVISRESGTMQLYVDYNNVRWCYNIRQIE